MAQTGSLEGVYLCVAPFAWSVAHKGKPGFSRHPCSRSPLLCDRMWQHWDSSALISIMQHLCSFVDSSSCVDRLFGGGRLQSLRSLRAVHLLGRWSPCSAFFPSAHLASLCLGSVEREKSSGLQKFGDFCTSAPRQSQALLLSVAACDRCIFSYQLSSLVVEPHALFGHRLIVLLLMLLLWTLCKL
jgi:hypothetical protein